VIVDPAKVERFRAAPHDVEIVVEFADIFPDQCLADLGRIGPVIVVAQGREHAIARPQPSQDDGERCGVLLRRCGNEVASVSQRAPIA